MIWTIVQVALGGAIGATGRFLAVGAAARLFGGGFPWGTLAVNVVGSFVMGWLVVMLGHLSATRLSPFLLSGILGGFTTFSAFSLDTVNLIERGATGLAATYVLGSVCLSVAGLAAGLALARGVLA